MGLSSSPEGKGALPERGGGGQLVAMLVKQQVIKSSCKCQGHIPLYLGTSLTKMKLQLFHIVLTGHSMQSAAHMYFAVHPCDEAAFSLRFTPEVFSDANLCMERMLSRELCFTRVLAV